jgi:hypothetical protein
MVRSGISFTEDEMYQMEYFKRTIPDLGAEVDEKWFRNYFDEQRIERLSMTEGLDEKIQNGVIRYGGTVSAEGVRDDCTHIMYAQTKAQVFNIIESQFDAGTRQEAVKRAVENVLSKVSDNIDAYLRRSLIEGLTISQ